MISKKNIPFYIFTILILISISIFVFEYKIFIYQEKLNKTIGPSITLKGKTSIKLNLFDSYLEPGYFASDNYDGDVTDKIAVTNNIQTNRIGTYQVSYTVIDTDGNKTVKKRNVEILAPSINNSIGIPILMYHFFYDSSNGETGTDNNFVDINNFDQQIKYLVDNRYYFPTWTELDKYIDGKIFLPENSIIISVDDASDTFFNLAYPILVKYHVPATSFVISSWRNPASLAVDKNLISFQSHSHSMHQAGCSEGHGGRLMCIDHDSGVSDLNTSISIVKSSDVFCYPFGDYNDAAKQMLRDAGFQMAVTTEYGKAKIGDDKLQLARIRVSKSTTLESFVNSLH